MAGAFSKAHRYRVLYPPRRLPTCPLSPVLANGREDWAPFSQVRKLSSEGPECGKAGKLHSPRHSEEPLALLLVSYSPCFQGSYGDSSKGLTLAAGTPQPPWLTQLTVIALASGLAPGACVEAWPLAHCILQGHPGTTSSRGSVWCKNGFKVVTYVGMQSTAPSLLGAADQPGQSLA